ncbi:hypothetical protein BIT28_10755 [Photobacterium proteolyticum]|uniref:Uncharacterized protein n=1 Tax=Photobacterium proteolyticum TaxID=1903952 RepID=A0A1Q9G6Q6_9GAMM|nr:hypothetical protein [Photobacterium proteolyticum]OLQ70015.1 hypothetical protein BIT28_10755 [Photobacterium proteolyticum]
MGVCLIVDDVGKATISNASESECVGYVIPSAQEYKSFINPALEINLEIFNLVVGSLLVAFIVGHYTGRVARYLGKY